DNNVYFDPDFLELPNKDAVDLSQFENNEQLAGSYYVDIYVNTNLIGAKKLNFDKNRDNQLIPCLSLADLTDFGVKTAEYPELQSTGTDCVNLAAIPDAKSHFEFDSQRLYLSIPQIALDKNPRGYVNLENID
ncbi:FimD/PapC N-terminal domain-containing protein, partial [Enterobacter cloacae complex sp.6730661]